MQTSNRLSIDDREKSVVFHIDYGRMSEIDDGRRSFYSRDEFNRTMIQLKKQGHKLHMITPNICGCTLQGSFAYDFQYYRPS